MNYFQRFGMAFKVAKATYENADQNKLFKALFSYFNNVLYVLPDNFETYVTKGYQANPDVFATISMLARKFASVPMYVYEIKDGKKLKKYQAKSVNFDIKNIILKGQSLEEVEGTPLNDLLAKPNEMQGGQQFAEAWLSFLLITGNAFTYKLIPDKGLNKGKPTKVYPMPSQYIQIIGGGWAQPIEKYKMIIGNQGVDFDYEEINHTKLFNPMYTYTGDELYGQSPLKAALLTLGASNEGIQSMYKAYQNSGVAGLLSAKDPNQVLSVEQVSQMEDLIKNKIIGVKNSRLISYANQAVDYTQIGLSPVDLAVLDSLDYSRDTICRVYGVDPIFFSTDSASYNNKITASKKLVSDVIVPYLNLYRDFWNEIAGYYSVDGKKYYIDYDVTVLAEMQEDLKSLVDALTKMFWITPNEMRAATNYDKSDNQLLDNYYIPSNLVPIDQTTLDLNATLKNFDYPND